MIYQVALLATIGTCSWIVLDLVFASSWRRRIGSLAVLASAAGCWAAGELLLASATGPGDVLAARRILFLGVCALGPAWIWSVLEARSPGWSADRAALLGALALPCLAVYSTLYWDSQGIFVDGTARPPRHGPLFLWNAAYAWTLVVAGLCILLGSMQSLAIEWTARQRALVCLAVGVPLAANISFVLGDVFAQDPTPVALAMSALIVRYVVLDVILGVHDLPFARSEVVEQMETGFVVADHRGRIIDANPAAIRLIAGGPLEGRLIRDVVSRLERMATSHLEARGFWLRRRGQTVGIGLSISDRAEQRRLEHQVELTTRLEALGHLASGVAHEVNNPLAYLTANLGLLEPLAEELGRPDAIERLPEPLRELALDAPQLVSESREGAERIRRIVDQLGFLTVGGGSGDQGAEPAAFDLHVAIERARSMAVFGQKDADVVVQSGGHPEVFASQPDVVHILLHLLLNAIRAAGQQGRVEVHATEMRGGTRIEILDDGPGIPDSELPFVFDPLYTTERPGRLGLGLSLCWRLAGQNGGLLEARNRPEGGAVFGLWLPSSSGRSAA